MPQIERRRPCPVPGFSPLLHRPGLAPDGYLCPVCGDEEHRYRLLKDINGVPRRVDVAGYPCDDCMQHMHRWLDDGK